MTLARRRTRLRSRGPQHARLVAALPAVFALCLWACGGGASGAGPSTPSLASSELACASDADCVVSTFDSCCACPQCPGAPHALSRDGARLELEAARCDAVDCTSQNAICAVAGMCPSGDPVVAACVAGRCELRAAPR